MNSSKVRISARQLAMLKLAGITGAIFIGGVRIITTVAGARGYLVIALGSLYSFLLVFVATRLGRMFPDMTPWQYAELIFTKWPGKLVAMTLVIFKTLVAALLLRALGDFLITAILPDTPLSANIGVMLALVSLGAYMGLEAIARFNLVVFPFILLAWVAVITVSLLRGDLGWMIPLFDISPRELLSGSLVAGTLLVDGLIVIMFYTFVTDEDKPLVFKYTAWAVGLGTTILLLLQVSSIVVYSPELAKTLTFSAVELARDASLGAFLERVEALYLAVWIMGSFIRISIILYGACLGLSQVVGWKNHKYYLLVIAPAVFYISFIAQSLPESINWDGIFARYGVFYQLGFVFLLYVSAKLRGFGRRQRGKA